jgi:hypothetical protein
MDERTVLLFHLRCIHKTAYQKLNASLDSIAVLTVTVWSRDAQNLSAANDHHAVRIHVSAVRLRV